MNDNITRVIDNYVTRYQSVMHFFYNESIDTVRARLGVLDNYTPIKKKKKHEFSANSLIKLLYCGAYAGMNEKNTMIMQMNIDGLPCTLTFKIQSDTNTGKEHND